MGTEVAGWLANPESTSGGAALAPLDRSPARGDRSPLTYSLLRRRGPWKDALRRRLLAAADVLAVIAAALATGQAGAEGSTLWVCATLPVWIFLAKVNGLYDRDNVRLRHQTVDEVSSIFHWVVLAAGATVLVVAAFGAQMSAAEMLLLWGVAFAAAFMLRALARAGWRSLVAPEQGLIVGSGGLASAFARKLELERGHHLVAVGHLDLSGGSAAGDALARLEREVAERRYERVILALEDLDEQTLSRVVTACRAAEVKFSVTPPLHAMLGTAVELNHLAELPLIEFRTWAPSRSTMAIKRSLDVSLATVALIVCAPLLALAALAIRAESPGSPIFRQRRAGRGGVPFTMLKLRTMVADAEVRLAEVVAIDELAEPVFKIADDPRVTRVGRLLRRLSLDELPQLVNVIGGAMSLVGPRPEEVRLALRYTEAEAFRLAVRPGITGPMQVHGRGELSFQERMAVEREYVENYSLRKDLEILMRTVPAVTKGMGAY